MFTDFFANLLFPPVCVVCRVRIGSGVVCEACLATIELNPALMCGECHRWLGSGAGGGAALATGNATPPFVSPCHPDFPFILGGAGRYENPVLQSLIHNLKFRSISVAAQPLGDLLVRYVRGLEANSGIDLVAGSSLLANFVVMPIPLSRRRLRSRGYNQAELIARRFAAEMSLPLDTTTLIRTRYAKPQSDILDVAARRKNIRGVFAVTDDSSGASVAARNSLRGKNIILIDDVSTTGSTFYEASLALKSAGAGKIIALATAKTM
jgi:ComF family protein